MPPTIAYGFNRGLVKPKQPPHNHFNGLPMNHIRSRRNPGQMVETINPDPKNLFNPRLKPWAMDVKLPVQRQSC